VLQAAVWGTSVGARLRFAQAQSGLPRGGNSETRVSLGPATLMPTTRTRLAPSRQSFGKALMPLEPFADGEGVPAIGVFLTCED